MKKSITKFLGNDKVLESILQREIKRIEALRPEILPKWTERDKTLIAVGFWIAMGAIREENLKSFL